MSVYRQRAIAICGQIASGKSSIVRHLAETHGWDALSFGAFVRHAAETQRLTLSRETLQALGQQILDERGPDQFLRDVIAFSHPLSSVHLYDSVRHVMMLQALNRTYRSVSTIFLCVDDQIRYERFRERSASLEMDVTRDEFIGWGAHTIEQGIAALASVADACVDASLPLPKVLSAIENILSTS